MIEVWLCECYDADNGEYQSCFAFSDQAAAGKWADTSPHTCVIYSRVVDHPEFAEVRTQ